MRITHRHFYTPMPEKFFQFVQVNFSRLSEKRRKSMAEHMERNMVRGGHRLLHPDFFYYSSKSSWNTSSSFSIISWKNVWTTWIYRYFDKHIHYFFWSINNLSFSAFCTDIQASSIIVDIISTQMKNFCCPHSCMQAEHRHLIRLRASESQNIKKFLAFTRCEKTHPFIIDLGHSEHAAGFYNERIFCGSIYAYGIIDHALKEAQSVSNALRRKIFFEKSYLQRFRLLWQERIYKGGVNMFSTVNIILFERNIDMLAKSSGPFGICIDRFLKRTGNMSFLAGNHRARGLFGISHASRHTIALTASFYPAKNSEFIRDVDIIRSVRLSGIGVKPRKDFVKNAWISGGYEFSHVFPPLKLGNNYMPTTFRDIILSFFYTEKKRAMANSVITRWKNVVGRARFERATLCLKGRYSTD